MDVFQKQHNWHTMGAPADALLIPSMPFSDVRAPGPVLENLRQVIFGHCWNPIAHLMRYVPYMLQSTSSQVTRNEMNVVGPARRSRTGGGGGGGGGGGTRA